MISNEALKTKWNNFVEIRSKFDKNASDSVKETEDYKKSQKDYEKARNSLLELYYPLVSKVADRMHKKIREVDIDDLVAWGTDGLFHAIDRFDPTLENKFETFAIHRIKGSILDNIRQVDWVPRLVRQRHNKLQKARHALECDLGRIPTSEEMANHLGMTLEEFTEIEAKANPVSCVSIYSNSSGKEDGEELQIESYESSEEQPLGSVVKEEMFKKLMGRNFIPLERKIVHMHYYENMTMKEIAEKTGYSESRISQMHAKILERLQKKVALNPSYMSDLEAILQS